MSLEKGKISRRNLLRGGAAVLAGAAAGSLAYLAEHKEREKDPLEFLNVAPQPRQYRMQNLSRVWKVEGKKGPHIEQMKFERELSLYTGIKGPVPPLARIDFRHQLSQMWRIKLAKIKKEKHEYPAGTLSASKTLFESYDPDRATKLDILAYQGDIGRSIEGARKDVPLQNIMHLRSFKMLEPAQVTLLGALEKKINAMSLLSYSVTELMPTYGPQSGIGVEVYDWLLRNAGREYLEEGMPALHDPEFSFGPYQLTPGAFHDEEGHPRGAKLIESLSKNPHLPDTIDRLRGNDHHRAAYLLAVHNLALLVRRLELNRSGDLMRYLQEMPPNLVTEFVAAAHHNPHNAINAFEDYLYGYRESKEHPEKYKAPDFADCCRQYGDVGPYASKTRDNMAALRKYFAQEQVKAPSL